MRIEIVEKSKETRVQQASMLSTQKSLLDSNTHLYRSILSTYLPLIYGVFFSLVSQYISIQS